jgi:hypothetical protein
MTSWPDHCHPAIKNDSNAILSAGRGTEYHFVIASRGIKEKNQAEARSFYP